MNQLSCKLCCAVVISLMGCGVAAGATDVKLRDRVTSDSSVVRLGDVAEIKSDNVEEQRRLGRLLLMPAPAPGTQRFLQQREIQDLLAAHGEDISQVRIAGANQISITSPSVMDESATSGAGRGSIDRQAVLAAGQMKREKATPREAKVFDEADAERVHGELDELLVKFLTSKAGHANAWRVTSNASDRLLAMMQSSASPPKCAGGIEPWTGRQRFVIAITTPKGTMQMPVYADVALATQVVVAARPIERGGVITASHLEMQMIEYMPNAKERRAPLESIETLIGMEAREAIRTGEMVFADQVRAPLMVRKGEEISVTSQGGGIRVRTTARATQDGAVGDLIQVETLDKKDRYDARVIGARKVAVFTGARAINADPAFERTHTAGK